MIDFKLGVGLIITALIGGILFGCSLKLINHRKFNIFNIIILMGISIIFPFYLVVSFIKEKDKLVYDNKEYKEVLKNSNKFLIKECICLFNYALVKMPYITDYIVQTLKKSYKHVNRSNFIKKTISSKKIFNENIKGYLENFA